MGRCTVKLYRISNNKAIYYKSFIYSVRVSGIKIKKLHIEFDYFPVFSLQSIVRKKITLFQNPII